MNNVADKPGLDATLPAVPVILGGVERHLVYDFNAIVLAEKATGVDLLTAIIREVNATQIRGLLWAALVKESPELTLDQVGAWITPRNVHGLHQALILAWFGSIATDEKEAPRGEEKAQTTATV